MLWRELAFKYMLRYRSLVLEGDFVDPSELSLAELRRAVIHSTIRDRSWSTAVNKTSYGIPVRQSRFELSFSDFSPSYPVQLSDRFLIASREQDPRIVGWDLIHNASFGEFEMEMEGSLYYLRPEPFFPVFFGVVGQFEHDR